MLGSVLEPHTCYREIRAGHCLWVEAGEICRQRCRHDITTAWRVAADIPVPEFSEGQVYNWVREALVESVNRHLVGRAGRGFPFGGNRFRHFGRPDERMGRVAFARRDHSL